MKKEFKVIKLTNFWSSDKLRIQVEEKLNEVSKNGWEVISVGFGGASQSSRPIAFITISR